MLQFFFFLTFLSLFTCHMLIAVKDNNHLSNPWKKFIFNNWERGFRAEAEALCDPSFLISPYYHHSRDLMQGQQKTLQWLQQDGEKTWKPFGDICVPAPLERDKYCTIPSRSSTCWWIIIWSSCLKTKNKKQGSEFWKSLHFTAWNCPHLWNDYKCTGEKLFAMTHSFSVLIVPLPYSGLENNHQSYKTLISFYLDFSPPSNFMWLLVHVLPDMLGIASSFYSKPW